MEHLTDEQIQGYVARTLAPLELLSADDHLAACAGCRVRAASGAGLGAARAALHDQVLPAESHLSDEQVTQYVSGANDPGGRGVVERHLSVCAECAGDVTALRASIAPRPDSRRLWYAAAAAAVIVAVLVPVLRHTGTSTTRAPANASASIPGFGALSAADQQRVQTALERGAATLPPFLADLAGSPERLMGGSPKATFRLIAPQATAVVSDRPRFRWQPVDGARYVVTIVDDAMRPLAQSPWLSDATWTPEAPLPRGRDYAWQVTARQRSQTMTAPAPPDPLARIRVLDGTRARSLEDAARAHPDAHLLLGILYAEAGVRDEAEERLERVAPADDPRGVARKTLARLRGR